MENSGKKLLIAMSGGVDSSVAALLMKQAGCDCLGITMKLFDNEDLSISREHSCCSLEDVEDARSVARKLDIPYYVFNFADRFREKVMEPFVAAYERGETPNPCIRCNRYLKFEKLYERARELGCEAIATGHYARIRRDAASGRYQLLKALDETKDQSYVLYSLIQEQLAHTVFPLGELRKSEARELAERYGLVTAHKSDSQDICFVKDGSYADFIESFRGKISPEGDFLSPEGKLLGRHKGIIRYTIGQRKGLGIAFGTPIYVTEIRPEENQVVLGPHEDLFTRELEAKDLNLISLPRIEGSLRLKAKARYRHKEQWATVTQIGEDRIRVVFDEPQRAVTKGQAVVLYDCDLVVGGGTICRTGRKE